MGGSWFWIILIAGVAWQIIVAIMNERAKKQQEARLREAARRRQSAGSSPATASAAPPTRTPSRGESRAESLAQRRQAQLEELRRRRQAQMNEARQREQAAQAPMSTPPISRPLRESRPTPRPASPTPPPAAPPTRGRIAPTDVAGARRPPTIAVPEQHEGPRSTLVDWSKTEAADTSAYRLATDQPPPKPRDPAAAAPVTPSVYAATRGKQRGSDLAVLLAGGLKDAASLRRAIMLKEIIDPPIALRS